MSKSEDLRANRGAPRIRAGAALRHLPVDAPAVGTERPPGNPSARAGAIARGSLPLLGLLVMLGCTPAASRLNLATTTGGNAALFGQFRAYDGCTGQQLTFDDVVSRCAAADVVLFGEDHSDAVCNQLEAQLLSALAARPRPVALAMEFFEADTQAALDEYLERRIDEPDFRKSTRQGRAYVLAHRPLIEMCRAACISVIAANAPRRLVRDYRRSDLEYSEFRNGLDPADQCWLPLSLEYLTGAYRDRFIETMARHDPGAATTAMPTAPPPGMPGVPPPGANVAAPNGSSPPAGDVDAIGLAADLAALDEAARELAEAAAAVSQILNSYVGQSQPANGPASRTLEYSRATVPAESGSSAPTSTPDPTSMPVSQPIGPPPVGTDPEDFYRAQLLWDEALAESVATFRTRFPALRVMLIVGGFHVASNGGTTQKLRSRRPNDRVLTIVYSGTADSGLAFDANDCGVGDIIIYGIQAPEETMTEKPASMPAESP